MSVRSLIVCGTGTGVGKTVVTAALAAAWPRAAGPLAVAKPVQTGCGHGAWPPDLAFCRRHAGWTPPFDDPSLYSPCRFQLAASPHLAAAREKRAIDLPSLLTAVRALQRTHAGVLVEGAGGLLTPLSADVDLSDLFRRIGLPVLLAAHAGLGTLNHILLTAEAMERRRLPLCGIVLTRTREGTDPAIERDNRAFLATRLAPVPVLLLPYLGRPGRPGFGDRLRCAGRALWRGLDRA